MGEGRGGEFGRGKGENWALCIGSFLYWMGNFGRGKRSTFLGLFVGICFNVLGKRPGNFFILIFYVSKEI